MTFWPCNTITTDIGIINAINVIPPLHSLGQEHQNKVQHYFLGHETPLGQCHQIIS